jgi:hypothetical protein
MGTFKNETTGREGKIRGFVEEDGSVEGGWINDTMSFTLKGTFTKTKRGHLKGTVIQLLGEDRAVGGFRLDLAP